MAARCRTLPLSLVCSASSALSVLYKGGMAPTAEGELVVLGVAQDGGLPHLGCMKPCCMDARANGRRETPASIALHDRTTGGRVLIDATWAIEAQLTALQRHTAASTHMVDAIVLTHVHMGHITGLLHLGKEVAACRGLPVYCTAAVATMLQTHEPWRQLVVNAHIEVHTIEPDLAFTIDALKDVTITPIAVPHRDELADTMAFMLQGSTQRVFYCPDIDAWPAAFEQWIDAADVAIVDGTFLQAPGHDDTGRDRGVIPHPPIADTMSRLERRLSTAPGSVCFTHFNHDNPVLHDVSVREALRARGAELAHTGMVIPL